MTSVPLSEFAVGTLDASGAGTLRIGPAAHGVLWLPANAGIRMTGATPAGLATCYVYAGTSPTDPNFIDATYDVNNDNTDRVSGVQLRLGQYVFAVWTGGNPNADVTLTLTGTAEVP